MLSLIWAEAGQAGSLQPFESASAWQTVEAHITGEEVGTGSGFTLWPYLSVAASIALLVMSGLYFLNRDLSTFVYAETGDDEHQLIRLSDGSEIWLKPNSSLRYPKQFGDDERRVLLRGDATMQVVTDTAWPFFADNYGAAVRAMGTEFNVESDSSADGQLSILENVGGVMQMFQRDDPANEQTLFNRGDKAIFDGGPIRLELAQPPPPPLPDTLSRDMRIGAIISELQYMFPRRFIVIPNMPRAEEAMVRVNLEQDLLSIMVQLDTTANIDYDPVGRTVTLLKFLPRR
ncbi:MAG: FecR family protein [Saprospiraceae bacterium]|nr:FecR family protein [Saprospiraceae bacterium]